MAEVSYLLSSFPNNAVNTDRLLAEMALALVPKPRVCAVRLKAYTGLAEDDAWFDFAAALTAPEQAALDAVVAAHSGLPIGTVALTLVPNNWAPAALFSLAADDSMSIVGAVRLDGQLDGQPANALLQVITGSAVRVGVGTPVITSYNVRNADSRTAKGRPKIRVRGTLVDDEALVVVEVKGSKGGPIMLTSNFERQPLP